MAKPIFRIIEKHDPQVAELHSWMRTGEYLVNEKNMVRIQLAFCMIHSYDLKTLFAIVNDKVEELRRLRVHERTSNLYHDAQIVICEQCYDTLHQLCAKRRDAHIEMFRKVVALDDELGYDNRKKLA